jgi:hypothetical protein
LILPHSRTRKSATKFKSIYSYYGGKSRIAHLYPEPIHDEIIEPFCGAASYSALHFWKRVTLYDADPVTASIWRFLLSPDALTLCRELIPREVETGQKVSDILPLYAPEGLLRLLQAEANAGTQGARGVHNQITKFGSRGWHRILPKMEYWLPRIKHWRFFEGDYRSIPNLESTWFIDPPYNNPAGQRYRTQISNYSDLANWCRSRLGQVIVCENDNAEWLPFEPLVERRGVHSSYQKSRAMEAIYVQEAQDKTGVH